MISLNIMLKMNNKLKKVKVIDHPKHRNYSVLPNGMIVTVIGESNGLYKIAEIPAGYCGLGKCGNWFAACRFEEINF